MANQSSNPLNLGSLDVQHAIHGEADGLAACLAAPHPFPPAAPLHVGSLSFPALRAKTVADSEPELLRRRNSPEESLMPAVAKEESWCSGGQTALTVL